MARAFSPPMVLEHRSTETKATGGTVRGCTRADDSEVQARLRCPVCATLQESPGLWEGRCWPVLTGACGGRGLGLCVQEHVLFSVSHIRRGFKVNQTRALTVQCGWLAGTHLDPHNTVHCSWRCRQSAPLSVQGRLQLAMSGEIGDVSERREWNLGMAVLVASGSGTGGIGSGSALRELLPSWASLSLCAPHFPWEAEDLEQGL